MWVKQGEVVGPHPPQNHVGATAGSVEAREEVSATSVLTVEAPQKTNSQAGANSTTQSQKGNKVPPATPVARKMAREAGLDLNTIEGTGPNGRITKEDVQRAIALKTSTEATQPRSKPAGGYPARIRSKIGRNSQSDCRSDGGQPPAKRPSDIDGQRRHYRTASTEKSGGAKHGAALWCKALFNGLYCPGRSISFIKIPQHEYNLG